MNHPLDHCVHYGEFGVDEDPADVADVQLELLPDKVQVLRSKLSRKAKAEPKFRFYALYDRIYRKDVLEAAWKHVGRKGKAPGIDGVKAEDVLASENGVRELTSELHEELRTKRYRPAPIKRVYIPKADGSMRPLGIPTLRDRVVQMAVVLILEPIFEADFLDSSHGFRPGRRAHDALDQIRKELRAGRNSVYDANLKSYFDTIPHDRLLACVRMRVADRSVLKLIERWLACPVIECAEDSDKPGPPRASRSGTPQGGVISPLLANLYLHWLDKRFHHADGPGSWANARIVRYADDFVVLARYQSGQIERWLEETLEDWMGLTINREKSRVVEVGRGEALSFLGFTMRYDRCLHEKGRKYLNVVPSKKSLQKARDAIFAKTGPKKCYKPTPEVVADLNRYLRGWEGYFDYGYPRKAFRDLGYYARSRMVRHLNRRSQRKYHRPHGVMSDYQYLKELGMYWP
ncbi:MAG: group II intron reverse transcriptase/maturase [Verrucomicrobiota bacterium]